jgi:hypothetical protein
MNEKCARRTEIEPDKMNSRTVFPSVFWSSVEKCEELIDELTDIQQVHIQHVQFVS